HACPSNARSSKHSTWKSPYQTFVWAGTMTGMLSSGGGPATMKRAVVVGGWRTPFVKAGTDFADLDVLDLAKVATAETLARTETAARDVDEVIYGNVSRPVAY